MNLCSFYNDVNSIDEGTNKHISNQINSFTFCDFISTFYASHPVRLWSNAKVEVVQSNYGRKC